MASTDISAADLRSASSYLTVALGPAAAADWSVAARDLEWSAAYTLIHISEALDYYARHLATRATERMQGPDGDPTLPPAAGLVLVEARAAVLGELVDAADPSTLGWHSRGPADPSGFAAMGCDEILVHGGDIAAGLGVAYEPPDDLCDRVLRRLFPWAPPEAAGWKGLLWANGRTALDAHPRLGPDWTWHCKPLAQWDGSSPAGPA